MASHSEPMSRGFGAPSAAAPRSSALPYATVWLAVIVIVGGYIAIIDGVTRPAYFDSDPPVSEPLEYEADTAALTFAAVMLPLVFLHGARLKATFAERWLMWFVLCMAAFAKDFAYLRIPGIPLFVTDITLVFLLVHTLVWPRLRIPKLKSVLMGSLVCFLLLGTVALARGLLAGQEKLLSFRDYAMVVYSLFLLIGLYFGSLKRLAGQAFPMIVAGALVAAVDGLAAFIVAPGQRRYIYHGAYQDLAVAGVLVALMNKKIPAALGWALSAALGMGVILGNSRTLYAALVLSFGCLMLTSRRQGLRRVAKTAAYAALAAAVLCVILLQTRIGADYLQRTEQELASGLLRTQQDTNAQFRLLAWAEAGRRFLEQPIMGEGFGATFTFEMSDVDVRPHNTYITILYKMGIVGAIPLFTLLGHGFRKAWKALRNRSLAADADAHWLQGLFVLVIIFCIYGSINQLFETPFLASVFWIAFGLMIRAARMSQAEAETLPATST